MVRQPASGESLLRSNHLYRIAPADELGIIAGTRSDRQILAHVGREVIQIAEFGIDGSLVSFTETNLDGVDRDAARAKFHSALDALVTIEVRRFYIEESKIGIRDYPRIFEEFLAAPHAFPGMLGTETEFDLRLWTESDDFVLEWAGGEYFVNRDGDVIGT